MEKSGTEVTETIEQYMVGVKVNLSHKLSSAKKVSFLMRQPTLEDMKKFEKRFPGWFLKKLNNKIEQDNDLNVRKVVMFNLLCESITGFSFTDPKQVPPLLQIMAANSVMLFQPEKEKNIKADFGPEYLQTSDDFDIVLYSTAKQNTKPVCQAHIFNTPTIEQIKEYENTTAFDQTLEDTEMRFQTKRTAEVLCNLYDSLIKKVSGYTLEKPLEPIGDGTLLTQNEGNSLKTIVPLIPALHKMTMIRYLFEKTRDDLKEFEGNL